MGSTLGAMGASTSAIQPGAAAVELLGRLIALDTVNPPGNEHRVQELLVGELEAAGFSCELLAAEPGRPNLVARLGGAAGGTWEPGPNLCLLGHADTVPAKPEEWSFSPFSGEVRDGEVLGRGAQDMKGQVAAGVAAACALARSGWRPARGELLVIVTADEEMGAAAGAKWLCENHAEKVGCEWVVNEGAGVRLETASGPAYTLCIGEKGVFRFLLRTRGRAGHGSQPKIGDNALLKLAPFISRLAEQPEPRPDGDVLRFLGILLGREVAAADATDAVADLARTDPDTATLFAEPMLGVSVAPTRAWASDKDNVIPSAAEILVDCRVPPGMGEREVRESLEASIGAGSYEIEFLERVVGNRSDPAGPLHDAIAEWAGRQQPAANLAPMVMPGFSDSHWFRKELGSTAFGFFPQQEMTVGEAMPLLHSADERVCAADIELAAGFYAELAPRMLG